MIKELHTVALARGLPERGLEAGDLGTIVHAYEGGHGYEVEFVTLQGETLAVVTVPADAVRPIRPREIAHVRQVP
jgi:hypothetical protein